MVIAEVRKSTEQKMHKSVEAFKADLAKVRTGRAHPGLLDHVMVDYSGRPTPLNQLAKVHLSDARPIGVTPFEKKVPQAVDKAAREAVLGVNPATTGDTVRVPMPPLTEERRKELIKVVKHEAENARVAVRNLRRDAIHSLKEALKKKEVSENDERRAQDEVQKMTDRNIAEIDKLLQSRVALANEVDKLHRTGVRLKVVGDTGRFDPAIRRLIEQGERLTAENRRLTLTVAANYGGRWDILQALSRLMAQQPAPADRAFDESALAPYLAMSYAPEPDLFIRTGGEQRISNFLLWQLAYAELYFTDTLWPDFDAAALDAAVASYRQRGRRFGRTGEQAAAAKRAEVAYRRAACPARDGSGVHVRRA